jgi:formate dehydrogenase alpha subunit
MTGAITIDGRKVSFADGQTVLAVARENGIRIPTLCFHRKLVPEGRCRVCLVRLEGRAGLQPSCRLVAQDGMVVTTADDELVALRRELVGLMLSNGEHNCIACERTGQCELQSLAYALGVESAPIVVQSHGRVIDTSSPMILRDMRRCIACGRCVAACNTTVVNEVLGFANRGEDVTVVCDDDLPMAESSCVQCGECVQMCPVGALIDKKSKGKGRPWELHHVVTTCPYCGTGCQLVLHVDRQANRIVRVTGREGVPPNDGMLCVKGRYGYEFPSSEKRLTAPLIKKNGVHVEVSWEEALDYTYKRIKEIVDRDGPDVFSAFGSGRVSNELNYAIMKFTRAVIKTNNVDHCARVCHAPTVAGLAVSFGSGAMTNSIQEIQDAEVLFVIGSNTTEAHPVISYYMKRAAKKGATLIVTDPRRIDLSRWATRYVQIKPGTDVAYLNGLINEIFKNGWENREFIESHTENPDDIRKMADQFPVEKASQICGAPVEVMKEVARILATRGKVCVCYTLGITEHNCGTDNVKAIAALQMVLGGVGQYATGVNPLRGQNNVQGACDMGALPNVYQTYQPVDDPEVARKFEAAWGVVGLSTRVGYKIPTMLRKIGDGGTKILYCIGDNTAQVEPNVNKTIEELKRLEFFVVCDIFPTMTTPYAHVIFPDHCWGEFEGTYTNTERRVSRVRKALEPHPNVRPQWWVLQELARRFGVDLGFTSEEAIWTDMQRCSTSYAGITWSRCDDIGLQWPCPTLEHPGTPFLHKDGKFTRGKGLFDPKPWRPATETPDAEYPFWLSTGRRLWHYHTGTQTRNSVGLEPLFPEELLEIHPDDAAELRIKTGDLVKASSRRGSISLRAWVTERSARGVIWTTFHFAEACGNVLTNDAYDDVTETPEYKCCAIKVEKLEDSQLLAAAGVPGRQARP